MAIAAIIPDEYFNIASKDKVIAFIIKLPVPHDMKRIILTNWAQEVSYILHDSDYKAIGV
mgnify:FL=1